LMLDAKHISNHKDRHLCLHHLLPGLPPVCSGHFQPRTRGSLLLRPLLPGHLRLSVHGVTMHPLPQGLMANRPRLPRPLPTLCPWILRAPPQFHDLPPLSPGLLLHSPQSDRPRLVPPVFRWLLSVLPGRQRLFPMCHRHLLLDPGQHPLHRLLCAHFDPRQRHGSTNPVPLHPRLLRSAGRLCALSSRHVQKRHLQRLGHMPPVSSQHLRCHCPCGR